MHAARQEEGRAADIAPGQERAAALPGRIARIGGVLARDVEGQAGPHLRRQGALIAHCAGIEAAVLQVVERIARPSGADLRLQLRAVADGMGPVDADHLGGGVERAAIPAPSLPHRGADLVAPQPPVEPEHGRAGDVVELAGPIDVGLARHAWHEVQVGRQRQPQEALGAALEADAGLLARILGQGERRDDGVERAGRRGAVDVAVGRHGDIDRAAVALGRAQGLGELVDHGGHVRRQAGGLGLTQLAPGFRLLAHGRQHPRQFEPHPRGAGLLVEEGAEQHGRLAIALQPGQHHAVAEARLGPDLGVRVLGQGVVDRLGVGDAPLGPRLLGQAEQVDRRQMFRDHRLSGARRRRRGRQAHDRQHEPGAREDPRAPTGTPRAQCCLAAITPEMLVALGRPLLS